MIFSKLKEILTSSFSFSKTESRGILLLLPLLIVLGVLIAALSRPTIEKSFPLLADRMIDSTHRASTDRKVDSREEAEIASELFNFDPNTIDYRGYRRLGFSRQDAAALISYRTKYKKVFEIPTDFAACYQVTDSIFDRLEPYISIAPQFKREIVLHSNERQSRDKSPEQTVELFTFDPNTLDSAGFVRLGFSERQMRTILKYRDMIGGFKTVESFGECYGVEGRLEELRPYINIAPVKVTVAPKAEKLELNSATHEQLVKLRGIGETTATRIIEYRNRLGGFYDIRQLWEVEGVLERNFELFSKEIFVDSDGITKIDVNFATAEIMENHPYISGPIIRKILKYRQLEGRLLSTEEMINGKILSKAEAEKLSHYLMFAPFTQE